MKKIALAILIAGVMNLVFSSYFKTDFHNSTFWAAAAACFLGLHLFDKKKVKG